MNSDSARVVFVTAPDIETARNLAKGAVEKRLAACANLLPQIESIYWWQEKIESSQEILILFKSTDEKLKQLEEFVLAEHPYDTPEFIALPVGSGNPRYLKWIADSVRV